jgi:quinol monooxygenase YgiN
MLITLVHIQVKPDYLDAFIAATRDNAIHSVQEAGVARFDFIQQDDDPTRFTLIEVYRNAEAPALHKSTSHYLRWRETVEPMMAVPRQGVKYTNIFPDDQGCG